MRLVPIWCEKSFHASSECKIAMKMSLEERREFIKKNRACMIYLKKGHIAKTCRKNPKCIICSKRHFTLMCSDLSTSTVSDKGKDISPSTSKQAVLCVSEQKKTVLLQTLKVNISNGQKVITVRALIDSGAQRSFICQD